MFSLIVFPRIGAKFSLMMLLHLCSFSRIADVFARRDIHCLGSFCAASLWRTKLLCKICAARLCNRSTHHAATALTWVVRRGNSTWNLWDFEVKEGAEDDVGTSSTGTNMLRAAADTPLDDPEQSFGTAYYTSEEEALRGRTGYYTHREIFHPDSGIRMHWLFGVMSLIVVAASMIMAICLFLL